MSFVGDILDSAGGAIAGGGLGYLIGGPVGGLLGATLGGGIDAARAGDRAAEAEVAGIREQVAEMRRQYNLTREDYKPFRDIELERSTRANEFSKQIQQELLGGKSSFETSPGYQFRMDQAMKAANRQASAQGYLNTPQQQKQMLRYGQGIASDEYNKYIANLFNASGQPMTPATNATAQAGQQTAAGVGQAYANMGNSRAAGIINQSNAYSNAINQIAAYGGYRYGQTATPAATTPTTVMV